MKRILKSFILTEVSKLYPFIYDLDIEEVRPDIGFPDSPLELVFHTNEELNKRKLKSICDFTRKISYPLIKSMYTDIKDLDINTDFYPFKIIFNYFNKYKYKYSNTTKNAYRSEDLFVYYKQIN